MPTNPNRIAILAMLFSLLSCDPVTYVTNDHQFKDNYIVAEINAPSFSFPSTEEPNEISILFDKKGEFKLRLSQKECTGTYKAKRDGSISILSTSCSQCCETQWDEYVLTLLKKVKRYEGDEGEPLHLYIDQKNYITLSTIPSNKPALSAI